MITEKKLNKFIEIRNNSQYQSNLQFQIDLDEAGIVIDELGGCEKVKPGLYKWETSAGTLVEENGELRLEK